mmetsp:Transcript_19969/g.36991  ORF Transcript_19969/g.36991 Transcript_19969/m.36991 type:complete len:518 (+) Transcript_19969:2748-4301(+)
MNTPERLHPRLTYFMQSFSSDSLRLRNEENAVELRKNKRSQEHIKRRLKYSQSGTAVDRLHQAFPDMAHQGMCEYDYLKMLKWVIENPKSIEELQDSVQVLAIKMSRSKNLPTYQVVTLGYVPLLVSLCKLTRFPLQVVSDSVWVLVNIASGDHEHSKIVVEAGGDEVFLDCMLNDDPTLSIHGIWGIGNIAGDCVEYRDKLLGMHAAECLMEALEIAAKQEALPVIRKITWAVKNLVRGKPPISLQYLDRTLPMISSLSRVRERKIVKEALWAVVNILESEPGRVQTIINNDFLEVLISSLRSEFSSTQLPAVRAIGNVAAGNDVQTQTLLNLKILEPLSKLLESESELVRKEAYWTLSNLVASSENQIREIMGQGILSVALHGLVDTQSIVKEEALWVFSNLCSIAGPALRLELIQIGILDYCNGYSDAQPRNIINLLSIYEKILSASEELGDQEQVQSVANLFYEANLIGDLEKMCQHGNQAVSDFSLNLMKHYFDLAPPQLIDTEPPETFVFT